MALSGLDIYKLLPKTNCRKCGFATCLAFAMQIAKKSTTIDKCPFMSEESKSMLEASSQPPIKLITIGSQENKLEIGNETVLFRHEEKFHHPCGIGFILEDTLTQAQTKEQIEKIKSLNFERVGQHLDINLIALRHTGEKERFLKLVRTVLESTSFGLVLISSDPQTLKEALQASAGKNPLIYSANKDNLEAFSALAKEFGAALVAKAADLSELEALAKELSAKGVQQIILDTGAKSVQEKVWDLTQIRRQALKKSNRALGFPVLTIVDNPDPYAEAIEAATYISKYSGIVLIKGTESWEVLSLLTLRQNIYTDHQKPLKIDAKLYPVGAVSDKSPVLVTTNFSLTYYTVLGEVEASKVPAYIITIDTEGMSVLTAWAAEKLTPEKIASSMDKFGIKDAVSHKKLVIPGYIAVMSGELEDKTGWQIFVGPKEAAGIPSFLKKNSPS
ncbi:MAG: acetyl-CoA decarbonylase/synthase complex subunit gamma [Candidatus Omnitrophica bacterium]|nr:acetyl-CoA decarbonylase/synthase complex subunit gamma [Candidatus Omnitrophota bacterium]